MSTTENILFLFAGVHGAVLIWLCFDRDALLERIIELESK